MGLLTNVADVSSACQLIVRWGCSSGSHTHTLREWYEPEAMMLSEETVVVCGLLMGLNALDYNVMMKGEDFDKSVS